VHDRAHDHGGRLRHDQPDGNGAVANVPIGLAMVASFSSQVNNWLTKTAESVFTMPASLTYSAGGMIYPTRLNDLTSQFTIADRS
jgi:conjugal transfer mating pair stabilization protein TraG